jgi:cbb3-type cytochrome oxidase subunit 1
VNEIFELNYGFLFGPITIGIFIYFSSMAVLYLLYSVMWKKWNEKSIYFFHIIALVLAAITLISRSHLMPFLINAVLLIFVIVITIISYNQKSKKENILHITYLLLSIFFILNIMDILIPRFLETYRLLIYLASSGIFLTILYKVLRKAGN